MEVAVVEEEMGEVMEEEMEVVVVVKEEEMVELE